MIRFYAGQLDLSNRQTVLAIGAVLLAVLACAAAFAVGTGDTGLLVRIAAVLIAPVLLFAAIRVPYVFPFGVYILLVPFDQVLTLPGAGSLTRYLGLATIVAIAVYIGRTRRLVRPPAALILWLGFFLWLALELFRTVDAFNGPATFQAMLSLIVMFGVLACAPITEAQLRFLFALTIAGGVIAGLYGMVLFHQHPELLAATMDSRVTVSVMGRTLDANMYAGALLAPFAFALVGVLNGRSVYKVIPSLTALFVIGLAIVSSQSREALISCAVVVAVLVWFSRRRMLGVVFAVPAFALLPILMPSIGARLQDGFKTGGAGRTSIWHVDWTAFLQHPFIGWGTGNSIEAYNRNYLAIFQAYNAGWGRPPHNTLLFIAVEFGLIGVALFVAAWLASFPPLKRIRRGDSLYDMRVGLTASLFALCVAGFFVDVSATKHFWLILMLAAQLRTVTLTRPVPVHTPVVDSPVPRPRVVGRRASLSGTAPS